ncbi:MAG: hypothetical protein PHE10_07585 [Kiritimatiellae bacterium]|nr:hypothetical protein [Kiritimatiellia bacterium]
MSGKEDTITIKVETAADNGGLDKARASVKGLAKASQAAGNEGAKAASKSQTAFTKLGQCIDDGAKKLQKLVTGFGSFAIIQQAFSNYRAALAHVNETLAKQKDYLASTLSGNTANAVNKIAEAYDRIKASVEGVTEAMAHADKISDMRLANTRRPQGARPGHRPARKLRQDTLAQAQHRKRRHHRRRLTRALHLHL